MKGLRGSLFPGTKKWCQEMWVSNSLSGAAPQDLCSEFAFPSLLQEPHTNGDTEGPTGELPGPGVHAFEISALMRLHGKGKQARSSRGTEETCHFLCPPT